MPNGSIQERGAAQYLSHDLAIDGVGVDAHAPPQVQPLAATTQAAMSHAGRQEGGRLSPAHVAASVACRLSFFSSRYKVAEQIACQEKVGRQESLVNVGPFC